MRAVDVGDLLAQYLTHIGRVPLLSRDEEVGLAKRIERGQGARDELAEGGHPAERRVELTQRVQDGMAAFEHLILANTRLVVSVAKKYRGRGSRSRTSFRRTHWHDAGRQEVRSPPADWKFSTYATWWIRQAITRVIADHSRTIRLPVYVSDQINRMRRLSHEMVMQLHREPNPEELAEAMQLPLSQLEELLRARQPTDLVGADRRGRWRA